MSGYQLKQRCTSCGHAAYADTELCRPCTLEADGWVERYRFDAFGRVYYWRKGAHQCGFEHAWKLYRKEHDL